MKALSLIGRIATGRRLSAGLADGRVLAAAAALALSIAALPTAACFIDGRALSLVEDINGAREIYVVRPGGEITTQAARYTVLRVIKGDGSVAVGETIERAAVPMGLLVHAKRLMLFHHAAGYWDVRPTGMLEKFVDAVLALPTAGPDDVDAWRVRLEFFLPYLNFMDITIAQAAEQEFSKAPYRALLALRPLIDRQRVLTRLARPSLTDQELQTKLTLLAVSGGPADAAAIAPLIEERWQKYRSDSLATLLATHVELTGLDGLALIEQRYLRDPDRQQSEIEAALRALRFHLRETSSKVPAEAALATLRVALERPRLAPLVIPDLIEARDWQALPQVVALARSQDMHTQWIRERVLEYLHACPLPDAKAAVAMLDAAPFAHASE